MKRAKLLGIVLAALALLAAATLANAQQPPTPTPTPLPSPTPTPTTSPTPRPTPAQALAPEKPAVSVQVDTAIELSWPAVSGATSYEVWAYDEDWQVLASDTPTYFRHTDFVPGTRYWYLVRAVNDLGERSAWSDYVSAIGPAATTATPTATPLPASTGEVSSAPALTAGATSVAVQLSWNTVAHAQNYEIWRWFSNEWRLLSTTSNLYYTDEGVSSRNTYLYTVAGINGAGNRGPWSSYATATIPAAVSTVIPTVTPTPSFTPTPSPTLAPTSTPTQESHPERAALISLYRATNGASWARNDNWLSNAPLSRWYGVSTDANGTVTSLVLYGNRLRGSIPSELGNLTSLRSLVIDTNDLSGTIPPELGNLTNLAQLRLYNNNLTGQIPSEVANLPKLASILLDNEQESLVTLEKQWGESMRSMRRVGGVIVAATNGVSDLAVERVVEIITGMLTNRSDLLTAMKNYRTKVILRTVNYRGNPGSASYAPNMDAEYPVIKVIINARSGGLSSMPRPSCWTTIHEIAHAIHYSFIESQGCCTPASPGPPGSPPQSNQWRTNPAQAFDGQLKALYTAAMANGLWTGRYAATNHHEYWAETVPIWLGLGQLSLADYDPRAAMFVEDTLGDGAYVPEYCKG